MKRKLKLLTEFLFYCLLNPTFSWHPREGVTSLRGKMNIYFFLHKTLKKKYQSELQFIRKTTSQDHIYSIIFPYPFIETIKKESIQVLFDKHKNLFFVIHEGKRLYFKRELNTENKVRNTYYCAYIEQHKESPHCYFTDRFNIANSAAS